ncbi:MAG: GAF domain-containing protein [bacterium]
MTRYDTGIIFNGGGGKFLGSSMELRGEYLHLLSELAEWGGSSFVKVVEDARRTFGVESVYLYLKAGPSRDANPKLDARCGEHDSRRERYCLALARKAMDERKALVGTGLRDRPIHSVCAVPLTSPSGPSGALVCVNKLEGRFTRNEVDLLSIFGNHLGRALEIARARRRMFYFRKKLSVLYKIMRIRDGGLSPYDMLGAMLDDLVEAMDCAMGYIMVRGSQAPDWDLKKIYGRGESVFDEDVYESLKDLGNRVLEGGEDSIFVGEETRSSRIESLFCKPFLWEGKPQGVIGFVNKADPGGFDSDDIQLVDNMVNQFGLNPRRSDERRSLEDYISGPQKVLVERLKREIDIGRRKIWQLETLIQLISVMNSTLQRGEILKRATEAAAELVGAETGSLWLVDEDTDELYFGVVLGDKGRSIRELRLKRGEGIAGWAWKTGKPCVVTDVKRDPRHFSKADELSGFVSRDTICVPIRVHGKIMGVLQVLNKMGGDTFHESDIPQMENFANQIAIALENANLYEEVERQYQEIKDAIVSSAQALAQAIELRDAYTGGHIKRVLHLSLSIARRLGLPPEEIENIRLGAILHDIGKIGIDDSILHKPHHLTSEEEEQMRMHPQFGAEIMRHIKFFEGAVPIMRYHHERYDGSGYPDGIAGEDIPLGARIVAVADAYDSIITDRPYHRGLSHDEAVGEIVRCSGTQFDPKVVEAFVSAYRSGKIFYSPDSGWDGEGER